MGQCCSYLGGKGGSRDRTNSVAMGNEGKFVSPDALEASIFAERGVPPSKPSGQVNNFTLTADVGTFDKLANETHGIADAESHGMVGANGARPVKRGENQTLMRRCFPPVGLLLIMDMDIEEMPQPQRQTLLENIREDVASAVTANKDRVRVIGLEKARCNVQVNVLADLGNGDTRSPMQLACDLVEQVGSRAAAPRQPSSPSPPHCRSSPPRAAALPLHSPPRGRQTHPARPARPHAPNRLARPAQSGSRPAARP